MASPFPGMDPYLEGFDWPSTNLLLSVEIARDLCQRLPRPLVARCPKDHLGPDRSPQVTIEIRDLAARTVVTRVRLPAVVDADLPRLTDDAHAIEIDLRGQPGRSIGSRYAITTRRAGDHLLTVIPVSIREPLPTIAIPLSVGRAAIPVNLQAALTFVYDWFGFDLELDYTRPPPVPLAGDDAVWAADLLAGRLQ